MSVDWRYNIWKGGVTITDQVLFKINIYFGLKLII